MTRAKQKLTLEQEKWLSALESGEFKQIHGVLKSHDGYCCLGVGCELFYSEHFTLVEGSFLFRDPEITDYTTFGLLSPTVRKRLGIRDDQGSFNKPIKINNLIYTNLLDMNDGVRVDPEGDCEDRYTRSSLSFKQIAEEVRKDPANFFYTSWD